MCWGERGQSIFGGWYEASHGNCSGGNYRTKPREKRYPALTIACLELLTGGASKRVARFVSLGK